jgi:hypothetical protein
MHSDYVTVEQISLDDFEVTAGTRIISVNSENSTKYDIFILNILSTSFLHCQSDSIRRLFVIIKLRHFLQSPSQ